MGLVSTLKRRSERAVRRAVLSVVGAVLAGVGVGFLTAAAWMMLEDAYSAIAAALILAGIYAGLGLIILGLNASSHDDDDASPHDEQLRDPAQHPEPGTIPPLAEAFIIGLNAALAARGREPVDKR